MDECAGTDTTFDRKIRSIKRRTKMCVRVILWSFIKIVENLERRFPVDKQQFPIYISLTALIKANGERRTLWRA